MAATATATAVAVAATPLLTAEHVAALEGSWRRAAQLRAELAASTAALAEGERQLVSPLLAEMTRLCAGAAGSAEGAAEEAARCGWLVVPNAAGEAAEAVAAAAAVAAAGGSAEAAAVVGCVEGAVVQLLLSLQGLHQLCATAAAPAVVKKPDDSREDGGDDGEDEDEAPV